ncbi:hypothetical protein PQE20_04015 [Vibrio harveyi]|uniref:8-oxoguanine DNA glycosylase OGG fold protein n=1 Tax=Vibrio harveyi TaxID=669 RepID=UPI00234CB0B9|nr:hypothetical protein [Vibrio harveyi]WCP81170.1 hypothetical protein PQE20_04015 [Vibrio harveyi]
MLPQFIKENETPIYVKQEMVFDIPSKYLTYTHHNVIQDVFSHFPDNKISRSRVVEVFRKDTLYTAFFAVMIWGGVASCGDMQDNLSKMLRYPKEDIVSILEKVNSLLIEGKISGAFQYMDTKGEGKIEGLGESYYTKLFFFLCEANGHSITTPIFDKWTKLAYIALKLEQGEEFRVIQIVQSVKGSEVTIKSSHRVQVYEDFVSDMNIWARAISVSVSNLEEFIFGIDKRYDRTWSNPRKIFEKKVNEFFAKKLHI